MVHGGLVEEALQLWRVGERLLNELPPRDPDHATVRLHVAALRAMYQTLTGQPAATKEQLADCEQQLESAAATIRHVREKQARDGASTAR